MKKLLHKLFDLLGVRARIPGHVLLTPAQFTRECTEALRKRSHDILVEVPEDLVLNVTAQGGHLSKQFLSLPYADYEMEPGRKKFFIRQVVASVLDSQVRPQAVDRSRIVPVVKGSEWFRQNEPGMLHSGDATTADMFWEALTADLFLFYAEDSPTRIRYLSRTELETTGIAGGELRSLAGKNLMNMLRDIDRHSLDGFYMITAGGIYEASLLLVDSFWSSDYLPVKGDFVIAVPTRDVLLVAGSEDEEGISRMRTVVKKHFEIQNHRLTDKLFTYKNGNLSEF
jgi:uncharacterized protein YtpQ (UPF0354 family)